MKKTGIRADKKFIGAFLLLALLSMTGGCAGTEETEEVIVLEQEKEEVSYELALVSRGDVEKTWKLKCVYRQTRDQEVSFALSGRQISRVYVREGEHVEKGQLLAELSGGDRKEEISRLEYQIARNKLLLEHALINENYEISMKWLLFLYRSGQSETERKNLEKAVEDIQKNYRYLREDCQDAIDLDELQLEQLQDELKLSYVYADMNGTVTWVKEGLEGATSVRGEKVMTVIDGSRCFFTVEGTEYAEYFAEGVEADLSIVSGTSSGQYKLLPYQIDQWEEQLMFSVAGEGADSAIEVGTTGTITVVGESREQVLYIPLRALHKADGKCYVYVVGEGNMREIKWIEAGLYGDACVEVTAGLSEGEKVILK